ncbi:MAG: hypothetical protein ACFFCO_03090 [Promethearchaeota archaeon]
MTIITCPKCQFRFDTTYGRAMACGGCPSASLGSCGYAKCPKCQHEFAIDSQPERVTYGRRVA